MQKVTLEGGKPPLLSVLPRLRCSPCLILSRQEPLSFPALRKREHPSDSPGR